MNTAFADRMTEASPRLLARIGGLAHLLSIAGGFSGPFAIAPSGLMMGEATLATLLSGSARSGSTSRWSSLAFTSAQKRLRHDNELADREPMTSCCSRREGRARRRWSGASLERGLMTGSTSRGSSL
jgi:hypothetical protein